MLLRLLALSVLVAVGCSGSEPPPPVAVATASPSTAGDRPLSSREPSAPGPGAGAADPVDPAEPGIGDLPRLARYVFRTMRSHADVCAFDNPYAARIHFTIAIDVKAGRMAHVGLGHAGLDLAEGQERTLPGGEPPELAQYVACLEPHLRELRMDPAPTDGTYEPVYQYPGRPGGRALP